MSEFKVMQICDNHPGKMYDGYHCPICGPAKKKRFKKFEFEGWTMGKFGVCFRTQPDEHLTGYNAVKLADLATTDKIQTAARAAGYTTEWDGRDYRWYAP